MKTCFKCGESKDLEKFYKHPMMADGRLGKCMECTKRDSANRIELKKLDPEWVMKERERNRRKKNRRGKSSKNEIRLRNAKWAKLNKVKRIAQQKATRAVIRGIIAKKDYCEDCGISGVKIHKHHHDYSKPLNVVFLCVKCHGVRHRKPHPAHANAS